MNGRRLAGLTLLLVLAATPALAGSIGGTIFEDVNRNGVRDAGEPGLPGLAVELHGAGGAVVQSGTTAADGSYLFAGLADGDYVVSSPTRSGFRASLPDPTPEPAPVSEFPFGLARYGAMRNLATNLGLATTQGIDFRHVALGDSIGFGFNACGSLLGGDGYIEPTTHRVRTATAATVLTDKQAIPGHETADLLKPGIGPDDPFASNDVFYTIDRGAPLVSISIGGNDFLGDEDGGDVALSAALNIARKNIQETLSGLLTGIPYADVEINTVYDNLEGNDPLHNVWVPIWNQVLRETAWGQSRRVTIAEVYPEYAHDVLGAQLGTPGLICQGLFGIDGIHPTNTGYDVHEEKLWQAFGGVTLTGGGDRLDLDLGFLRVRAFLPPAVFTDVAGGTTDPELALVADFSGARIASDNRELRLSNFLPVAPPAGQALAQAVVYIRYRTTAAPVDDHYRFEASIDGSFAPAGSTPTTWNTIIPIVGAEGNQDSARLVFPDQPGYRVVSAPLYLGAPTTGAGTLTADDLATLSVRVVTTAVGTPDDYAVDWDAAAVQVFTAPEAAASVPGFIEGDPYRSLVAEARRDPEGVRARSRRILAGPSPVTPMLLEALGSVGNSRDVPALRKLATETADGLTRGHAVRSLARLGGAGVANDLLVATGDPAIGVRRAALRALSAHGADVPDDVLARLVADVDPVVQRLAVRLAQRHGAEGLLLATSRGSASLAARVDAGAALLERGNLAGIAPLLEGLGAGGVVARRARTALAAAPDDGALDAALDTALAHRNPAIRAGGARVAGSAADGASRARLRALLGDDDLRVRVAAMDALARLGDRASIPAVAAQRENPRLTLNVVDALARLDGPQALDALLDIARSSAASPTARRRAARGIAASTAEEAQAKLRALAGSDDVFVRRLARAGLARLER